MTAVTVTPLKHEKRRERTIPPAHQRTNIGVPRPNPSQEPSTLKRAQVKPYKRAHLAMKNPAHAEYARKWTSSTPSTPLEKVPLGTKFAYHVSRTPSENLPVYLDRKRGGNLHLTMIRKIAGDARKLRDDVVEYLGLEEDRCWVNPLTNQVVMKGWHKEALVPWLESKRF